jgi:hypothetical protein
MEKRAAAVSVGDRFLCYLKGKFAWVGALEAVSGPYRSSEAIWGTDGFPVRVNVRPIVVLPGDEGLHLRELEGKLSFFASGQYLASVPSHFQGSPRRLPPSDGEVIFKALLARDDGARVEVQTANSDRDEGPGTVRPDGQHAEIQLLLARWGAKTGCRVWVPKADRQRVHRAARGEDVPLLLDALPYVFGGRVQSIIENIDVIWLRGEHVVAAFEVEHSTSIYSGLLRMSDLVASVPNLTVSLYIVAPQQRAQAVQGEVARPTFAALPVPLARICGFISYEQLRSEYEHLAPRLHNFRPEGIRDLAQFVAAD